MTCALTERHKRALSMIGHALTLEDDPGAWAGLSLVIQARLTPLERALLLASLVRTLDARDVLHVIDRCGCLQGAPLPALDRIEDDARWWADLASPPELRAWLTACFVRLPASEQAAFLESATRRDAA